MGRQKLAPEPRPAARTARPAPGRAGGAGSAAFAWPVRVYYEDTDAAGVVYHASYLCFLERARTEWLRARGFAQPRLAREHGVAFVVRSLAAEFLRPARLDDELAVTVEQVAARAGSVALAQRVLRGAEELVSARVRLACVNPGSFRPVRIPESLGAALGGASARTGKPK